MRRVSAVALVVILLMVACSSNDLADQGNRSRAGKGKNAAAGKNGGRDGKGKGANGSAPGDKEKGEEAAGEIDAAAPGSASGADAPDDFGGGDAPSSGIDPSLARASSNVDDSPSDAKKQGLAPPYTEATGASVQGLGKNVRFTMAFTGSVPERVQKGQYMVIAFGITGQEEDTGYALGATCDENGWKPYGGVKGDNRELPGSFQINGNEIVMEVPWTFLDGPRAFEWYSSTGWYGKVANQTHWSFDSVPNQKAGAFPGN